MAKIIFLLTLLGILFLIFLGNNEEFQSGTIKSIKISPNKITVLLKENEIELIIFDSKLDLQKGDKIKFQGNKGIYNGKEQIIINKILSEKGSYFQT